MAVCEYYEWCSTRQNAFPDSKIEEKYCLDSQASKKCQSKSFLTDELSRPDSLANLEKTLNRLQ